MGKILYFDCFSGISGDMTIGALLDLGIDQKEFLRTLGKINVDGYRVEITKKLAKGIFATDFEVILEPKSVEHVHHHAHRNLKDIENIIESSDLEESVKKLGGKIFNKIAVSEAKIHDKAIDEIHFHEV
ncbi:LarC family nickel insertion protein, partial [bacterium]|nr:LarC family nickel insertion protein [bacterium]